MTNLLNDVEVASRCELLRSLHTPGDPLLLPNAWDVPTARAVVAAGFPGRRDDERGRGGRPRLRGRRRCARRRDARGGGPHRRGVDVPVTVDAEAGYGLSPAELVAALRERGRRRLQPRGDRPRAGVAAPDPAERAHWLAAVRAAAAAADYPLVINARVDVFLEPYIAGADPARRSSSCPKPSTARTRTSKPAPTACTRSRCGSPTRCRRFMAGVDAPVNMLPRARARGPERRRALGVARVSWAIFLYEGAMAHFTEQLASLRD